MRVWGADRRWGTAILWGALAIVLVVAAHASISRVAAGRLFLFPLPLDRPPTPIEVDDAVQTARTYMLPAIMAACMIAVVLAWVVRRLFFDATTSAWRRLSLFVSGHRVLLAIFALATALDLATTLWFFHTYGVAWEFHPGVRLMGYAYGRSVGPILGKTSQAVGLFGLALVLRRAGPFLLFIASAAYLAGAACNLALSLR